MAGLMQPGMQAPMQGQPADPAMDGAMQASPEEQQQYETFVQNGMALLHDENSMQQMIESLASDGNPVEGAANVLAMLIMRLEQSAAENGQEISGDVKLHGAGELLEQIVELAEAAGVHDFSEDDMETVLLMAMDLYRESNQDSLPREELEQDFNELMAADQAGQIDTMVPGLSEYAAKRAPQGGPQGGGMMPGQG